MARAIWYSRRAQHAKQPHHDVVLATSLVGMKIQIEREYGAGALGSVTEPSSYVSGWAENNSVPLMPGAVESALQQAKWNADTWPPMLVLTGYGFGNPPTDASKATLIIADNSRGGNAFTVTVTNPQTGNSGTLRSVVPQGGIRPSMALNSLAMLVVGQSTGLSGRVTLAGQSLANQTVSVTTSSGTLGGSPSRTHRVNMRSSPMAMGRFPFPIRRRHQERLRSQRWQTYQP